MALELSTAGIKVKYCFEATAGVRPSGTGTTYTEIPGVKSIPEFGTDINTLQTTPLSAERNHTYIAGLRDSGGAIGLTVNDYSAFRSIWDAMMSEYVTKKATGLGLWVEFCYPASSGLDSFFFPAEPVDYGFGGADVDEVLENIASFIPTGDYCFATAI